MNLRDIIIVGVALAMDALGVTISVGLNSKVKRDSKVKFILAFAFFQFLLFFIGAIAGYYFETYVTTIPNLIGGITMGLVGAMMIKEGFQAEDRNDEFLLKKAMPIILGVSVSIDALVVGFTVFHTEAISLVVLVNSIVVGLITLCICTTGFYLCRFIRKLDFITKYADFFGGIILITFAIKIIFF